MGPIEALASHGVLGIVCAILFYWIWRKDKELAEERAKRDKELAEERVRSAEKLQLLNEKYAEDIKKEIGARVVDSVNFTKTALDLQGSAAATANRLTDVFEEVRKLMGNQQQVEREEMRQRPTITAPQLPTSTRGRYGGDRGGE